MTETNQPEGGGNTDVPTNAPDVSEIEPIAERPASIDPTPAVAVSTLPLPENVEVPASSRWDRPTKRTVIVIMIVAIGAILWVIRPVLPIIIFAGIIAYLLSPIVDTCDRLRIPRSLSTIILFLLLLIGFILLPVLLIPVLLAQLSSLANYNPQQITRDVINWLSDSIDNLPEVLTVPILGLEFPIGNSLQELQTNFQQYLVIPTLAELLNYMQQVIGTTTTVISSTALIGINLVGGIVQFLFTFLVIFFLSLYLTKDAPQIRSYVQSLFPVSYQPEFGELLRRISRIWQLFFRGQIVLSLIIGFMTWGSLSLVGMPGALILGAVAGALEIIPNLGPTLAMIPAVIVALIQGSDVLKPLGIDNVSFALITIGIYFVIQQFENNVIVPRVIGDSVNLHPIIVIIGIVIGFNVGGVLGAFLAAPVIASLRVVGAYIHAKLLDYPPFDGRVHQPPRRRRSYRRIVRGEELRRALSAEPVTATAEATEQDTQTTDSAISPRPVSDENASSTAVAST